MWFDLNGARTVARAVRNRTRARLDHSTTQRGLVVVVVAVGVVVVAEVVVVAVVVVVVAVAVGACRCDGSGVASVVASVIASDEGTLRGRRRRGL